MRLLNLLRTGLLAAALLSAGCAAIGLGPSATPDHPGPEPVVVPDPAVAPEQVVRQRLERLLAEDRLEQAQRELRAAPGQGVDPGRVSGLATQVAARLLAVAEAALAVRDYATAGRQFRLALEILPETPGASAARLPSPAELNGRIDRCADELMKEGLSAYRAGELVTAVAVWKQIGSFHPDHTPSQTAIATARQQLEALEKLAPDKAP